MVTVKRVESKADRRRFVDFPNQLYKDNPNFVPATYGDDLSDWDPKANPAFSYCDAQCFLAYRDGEIVGRIGAILSHRANRRPVPGGRGLCPGKRLQAGPWAPGLYRSGPGRYAGGRL